MDLLTIRNNCNKSVRHAYNSDKELTNALKAYYETGVEAPSIALINLQDAIKQQIITSRNSNEPIKDIFKKSADLHKNLTLADNSECIQPALNKFQEQFDKYYPKTGRLRVSLIKMGRITYLEPVKSKLNFIKKLVLSRLL